MAVTESSGNGFALYNGVKLPNIDSVWTDKETYPYFLVYSRFFESEGLFYYVIFTTEPCFMLSDTTLYKSSGILWNLQAGADAWAGGVTSAGSSSSGVGTALNLFLANYDVMLDSDIFLAATSPIPLDGMTVIEWDGDTEGMTMQGLYGLVTEKVPNLTKPVAEVHTKSDGASFNCYTEKAIANDDVSEGMEGYYWGSLFSHYYYTNVETPGIYTLTQVSEAVTTTYSLIAFYEGEATTETTFSLKSWLIGYALGLSGKPLHL